MLRRRGNSGCLAATLLAALICCAIPASATDFPGAVLQVAPSKIKIQQLFYYLGQAARECITFTNEASEQATNVDFVFAWRDKTGKHSGDEMINVQGVFEPGVLTSYSREENRGGCYDTQYAFPDSTVTAAVTGVRYFDGSLWLAVPAVKGRNISNESSVVLSEIEALAGVKAAPIKYPVADTPLQECATITNDSARKIKHVRIVFAHQGSAGNALGQDTLDVSTSLAPGSSLALNCNGFYGSTKPGVFHYARALSKAQPDTTPPQLIYKNVASTLTASVAEVDFADGTSWHAPP